MLSCDIHAETMNTSQLFMVSAAQGWASPQSVTTQTTQPKNWRKPLNWLASVSNLLYEISRNQIKKEYSLEFSLTEM